MLQTCEEKNGKTSDFQGLFSVIRQWSENERNIIIVLAHSVFCHILVFFEQKKSVLSFHPHLKSARSQILMSGPKAACVSAHLNLHVKAADWEL